MRATKCNAEFRRRSHFEAPGLHPSRKFVTAFVVAGPFFLSLPRIWQGVNSTCARQLNVKGIDNPSFRSRWNHFCTSFGPILGSILSPFCGPVLGSRKWPQFGAHPLLEYCFLFVGPKSWPENGRIFGAIFWPNFVIVFAKNWPPGGHAGGQACPCLWAWISKPSLRQQGIMQLLCIVRVGCLGPVLRPESGLGLMAIFWTSFWARGLDTNTALHFGARVSLSRKRTRFGARVFHRKTQQNSMHLAKVCRLQGRLCQLGRGLPAPIFTKVFRNVKMT